MSTAPDRPEHLPKFIVDTIAINPLEPVPARDSSPFTGPRRAAPPIRVWRLQENTDLVHPANSIARSRPPVLLSLWQHPAPPVRREVPLITDLTRALDSGRWRFEIENVPTEVGTFFDRPDAVGFQIKMWLDPQHLPDDHADVLGAAGKVPGWARVFLFDVPAPDRIPEGSAGRTETISGVAENFPDSPRGRMHVALAGYELCTWQGQVMADQHGAQMPPPGIYHSFDELEQARY